MAAKGISLHIGLNLVDPAHYAGWSGELGACEADAEDMSAIAKSQGYDAKTLLTSAATRSEVAAQIKNAAEVTQPGDIFFLTYSGHGGQLPDKNGDEDDHIDETWCLYDGELIDDSLFELFCRFKPGVRIFMLSDSCHSGTVSRSLVEQLHKEYSDARRFDPITGAIVGVRFRGMPRDVARKTYLANRAEYDRELTSADPNSRSKVSACVRLISGCQDDQLSSDGTFNGLFTAKLLAVWNSGKFQGDYRSFYDTIKAKMPKVQQPNHSVIGTPDPAFDAQRPFQI